MSPLAFFLLGPPQIKIDGVEIHIRRRKALAVLIYLAVTGKTHSRDALAATFWPEHDQSSARAGLRRTLTSIRKHIGEGWLDITRESVRIKPDADIWLDLAAFQEWVGDWRKHTHTGEDCPECIKSLETAVKLYRDDFLSGFSLRDCPEFDDWSFFQREELRSDLASALEWLSQAHAKLGEYEEAITHARRWVALDTLHEPAHCELMRLYAWAGQRAAAL
ncbi:MAG: hypothetical protein MUO76_07895, partial [Anaerolineaceae bacterium]|nr:hypothetical protein [Anaerolineaceae bacterium]